LCAHHTTHCSCEKIRRATRRAVQRYLAKQDIDRTPLAKSISSGTGLPRSVPRLILLRSTCQAGPLGAFPAVGVPKLTCIGATAAETYPAARRRAPCRLTWASTIPQRLWDRGERIAIRPSAIFSKKQKNHGMNANCATRVPSQTSLLQHAGSTR
jgi:hypothetical protein